MWLRTKLRTLDKKLKTNKDLKVPSDFKPALKRLKGKLKSLRGDVKKLKEENSEEYYAVRSSYRTLLESLRSGKSISSLEKAKKAKKAAPKKEETEEQAES